jgi:hypothetical protein
MSDTKTPDLIIDRAVELWCRALHRPRFDNGDSTDRGGMAMALHTINAGHDADTVDDMAAAVERFRTILSSKLKSARDNGGRVNRYLATDYGPEHELADAAKEAGVPTSLFSWKSSVSFYSDEYVSASFGYGADDVNHYPLPSGGWLICGLRGTNMPAIIKAVEEGRLPELTVEPASP